jgi:hypothetical protein
MGRHAKYFTVAEKRTAARIRNAKYASTDEYVLVAENNMMVSLIQFLGQNCFAVRGTVQPIDATTAVVLVKITNKSSPPA